MIPDRKPDSGTSFTSLVMLAAVIFLAAGVYGVIEKAWLTPGCAKRCAARGLSLQEVTQGTRKKPGGCLCTGQVFIPWEAPGAAILVSILSVSVGAVIVSRRDR